MEIEVGEYIRTESGIIAKVLSKLYEYKDGYKRDYDNDILNDWYNDEVIVKHSKNIIDLIEEKDIVNEKLVYSIGTSIGNFPIVNHNDGTFTPSNMIETILTHEQYEQNSYKIGE